jgi:parallel beta-helix repeat protein
VASCAAVVDGKVYVGSTNCKVYCLNASTGAYVWSYTTGGNVFSSPAVVDGKVYVGSYDHKVYCLDALNGALIWSYTTGGDVWSCPSVAYGKVYVGSADDKVYCLDALTGAVAWSFTTGNYVGSSPAVVDGKIYVGSYDHKVYCLDALTGVRIWSYTTGNYVASSPAVVDGKVYVGSADNKTYCLNAATGALIWSYTTGDAVLSSPAVVDGKVYVGSYDHKVYCLNALTGAFIWSYTTGLWVDSSPAVADGKVYVGSADDKVYCLDALTGMFIWSYKTGSCVWSSPTVADGMVIIGSDDGKVYAFGNVVRVTEKIQEAINTASPGATLIITPKVYNESVVINKPLTLLGEMGSAPIFRGGGSGIAVTLLSNASGSTIAGIIVTNWDQGILINGASNCKIYDNTMSLMVSNAITIQGSSANNKIYSNIFQDNAVAINLFASSATATIYKNIITSSNVGLSLQSNGNTVYGNTFSDNNAGIDVSNSHDNIIYHNNFDNKIQNAIIGTLYNVWDNGYPSGGNYWSSHSGVDVKSGPYQNESGCDGIVDKQYAIAVNNVDRYPLTQPFNPHDIGIVYINVSKTVVCQGFCLRIEVKILNYGIYDQAFVLTAYANTIAVVTQTLTVAKRSSAEFTLTWDTTGFAKGTYTISAYAWPVQDETDIADNRLNYGQVKVVTPGNVNGDGIVNMVDIYSELILRFMSQPGDSRYRPNSDINDNGIINYQDIYIAILHFMQTDP